MVPGGRSYLMVDDVMSAFIFLGEKLLDVGQVIRRKDAGDIALEPFQHWDDNAVIELVARVLRLTLAVTAQTARNIERALERLDDFADHYLLGGLLEPETASRSPHPYDDIVSPEVGEKLLEEA